MRQSVRTRNADGWCYCKWRLSFRHVRWRGGVTLGNAPGFQSSCRVPRYARYATRIARKAEANGRYLRQIEVCEEHMTLIETRERMRGLEIIDRR